MLHAESNTISSVMKGIWIFDNPFAVGASLASSSLAELVLYDTRKSYASATLTFEYG